MQKSCDGIMWSGIETGSKKPKVEEIFFFFLLVQHFPLTVSIGSYLCLQPLSGVQTEVC